MKLNEVVVVNEAGEEAKLERKDYLKFVTKENNVKDYENEAQGVTPAQSVVNHILKSLEDEKDIDEGIQSEYSDLISIIEADYQRSAKTKADKKAEAEAAKAAKEAEKAKREAEEKAKAEQLKVVQAEFALNTATGAELAAEEFKTELESLANNLPEGVTVKHNGAGYGIEFGADVDKNTVGQVLGYLLQKDNNSEFIGNQLTFWIGDTILKTVTLGIYATAKDAAKDIARVWSERSGKSIEAPSLDQYKRMSERTPIEYRNPKADPTAYLAISAAKAPRKDEKESKEAFEKRLKEFEADREELQKKLAVGELSKRKEIVPLVNEMLVKHGMKDPVDPNATVISISQQFAIFFHATFALEELLDTHEEGFVLYKDGETIVRVSKEELEAQRDSAKANLLNVLYTSEKTGLTPADYIRGFVMKKVKVEVAKDADKKPIYEDQDVKNLVYPTPFFEQPQAKVEGGTDPASPEEAKPAEEAKPKNKKK